MFNIDILSGMLAFFILWAVTKGANQVSVSPFNTCVLTGTNVSCWGQGIFFTLVGAKVVFDVAKILPLLEVDFHWLVNADKQNKIEIHAHNKIHVFRSISLVILFSCILAPLTFHISIDNKA